MNGRLRSRVILKIRRILEARGLPQKDLAEILGVSPAWICQLLSGRHSPTLDMLERLSLVLGEPVEEFFNERPPAPIENLPAPTEEERLEIQENLNWFRRLTPFRRLAAVDETNAFDAELKRGRRKDRKAA